MSLIVDQSANHDLDRLDLCRDPAFPVPPMAPRRRHRARLRAARGFRLPRRHTGLYGDVTGACSIRASSTSSARTTGTPMPGSIRPSSIARSRSSRRRGVLAKVVAKENLADDPEFATAAKQGLLDRVFGLFRAAKTSKAEVPSLDGIDSKLAPVIVRLFNKVDVIRVAKSNVLSISVSSRDPAKATRLANSLAQTYVEDQIAVHAGSVQQAAAFFEDRLGSLRDQVRASERAVADFRKAHNLTTTIMDGPTTVGEQQLQDLTRKAGDGERRHGRQARAIPAGDALQDQRHQRRVPAGDHPIAGHHAIAHAAGRPHATRIRSVGDLRRRLPRHHADPRAARRARSRHRRGDEAARLDAEERVRGRQEPRGHAARRTIVGLTDVSGGDNETGVKLRELERTNLANKALFQNFLNRAKLTQEQSTFEEPDARLILAGARADGRVLAQDQAHPACRRYRRAAARAGGRRIARSCGHAIDRVATRGCQRLHPRPRAGHRRRGDEARRLRELSRHPPRLRFRPGDRSSRREDRRTRAGGCACARCPGAQARPCLRARAAEFAGRRDEPRALHRVGGRPGAPHPPHRRRSGPAKPLQAPSRCRRAPD